MTTASNSDAAVAAAGRLIRAGHPERVMDFLLDAASDPRAGWSALFARYDHAVAADDEPLLTRRHLRCLASDGRRRHLRIDVPTGRRTQ